MTSFGEQLRSEREGRGVSLDTVCAETKVNRRHLQALEQGDYSALPGGVFRRGIVRAYLHAIGLEEEVWMSRFQVSFAEHAQRTGIRGEPDETAWATFAANVKKNRVRFSRRRGLRWFGVLALLIALAAGGWAVWHFLLRERLPALPASYRAVEPRALSAPGGPTISG